MTFYRKTTQNSPHLRDEVVKWRGHGRSWSSVLFAEDDVATAAQPSSLRVGKISPLTVGMGRRKPAAGRIANSFPTPGGGSSSITRSPTSPRPRRYSAVLKQMPLEVSTARPQCKMILLIPSAIYEPGASVGAVSHTPDPVIL